MPGCGFNSGLFSTNASALTRRSVVDLLHVIPQDAGEAVFFYVACRNADGDDIHEVVGDGRLPAIYSEKHGRYRQGDAFVSIAEALGGCKPVETVPQPNPRGRHRCCMAR